MTDICEQCGQEYKNELEHVLKCPILNKTLKFERSNSEKFNECNTKDNEYCLFEKEAKESKEKIDKIKRWYSGYDGFKSHTLEEILDS